ncbi:MAG: DUF3014 domain-containing protein [Longimicrobiales bacterium]|nr:DUF3014 domain-containing protein [Longimicrobiales bacterium]
MNDDPYRDPDSDPIFTSRRRSRGPGGVPMAALIAAGVLVVGGGAWWFWLRGPSEPEGISVPQNQAPIVAETPTEPSEPVFDLPPLESSDPWMREHADPLSDEARWSEWLHATNLVRRFAIAMTNLSMGRSPADQLSFMAPADTFTVVERDGRTYLDPASYRRYDGVTRVLASVNVEAAAVLYRGIRPLLNAAAAPLGLADANFDTTLARALGVVLDARAPDGPIEVVETGIVWAFADPSLEAENSATKHLIRLGPENLQRLQTRARAFARAAGLDPTT